MHHFLRRTRVHVLDAVLQRMHLLLRHQIGLADEYLIGKANLLTRFLPVVQLLVGVFGVHHGDDGVQQVVLGDLVVHEEGLRDRAWVGQTRGFDDHAVKVQQAFALFGGQQLQGLAQVFADRAADAAVAHLVDLLLALRDQQVFVDVFFTELVLDHGDLLAVRFLQQALEQRGFTRAQKAGEDGGRNQSHGAKRLRGNPNNKGGKCSQPPFPSSSPTPRPRWTDCFSLSNKAHQQNQSKPCGSHQGFLRRARGWAAS